jgi:hypothetical protein
VKGTASKSIYLDIKADQTVLARFTPTSNEDGSLFFESSQHFRFKEKGEKRTWACLRVHGGGDCPICDALERAEEVLGETQAESLLNDHRASNRWHAQVLPILPEGSDPVDRMYVVGLSKTTAAKVSKILKLERDTRQPLLTDPDKGQAISIEREGSGFNTTYTVMPSNVRVPLDKIYPKWEEKFLDVEKALKLRIADTDTLLASMKETFGDVVFNALTDKKK